MDEDDIPDTRVFVKGLPSNYASEQLGAHFAGRYQITDAVVLEGRHIGFVGFRNYTLAKNAVKYFDKTYIRMSKISVELAKPVDFKREVNSSHEPEHETSGKETKPAGSSQNFVGGTASTQKSAFSPYFPLVATGNSNKRKRQDGEESKEFKEYMDVMQPKLKSTWNNGAPPVQVEQAQIGDNKDDTNVGEVTKKKKSKRSLEETENSTQFEAHAEDSASKKKKKNKTPKHEEDEAEAPTVSADVEDDTPKSQKKKKDKKKDEPEEVDIVVGKEDKEARRKRKVEKKARKAMKADSNAEGGVEPLNDDASVIENHETDNAQPKSSKSDDDWLRGKTSRLLDLEDPEEAAARQASSSTARKLEEVSSSSDDDQTSEAAVEVAKPTSTEAIPVNSIQVPNGRLFVRNLPFSTDESDLEMTFGKFGKVSEVHVSRDFKSSASKGLAYIQFVEKESAERALNELDGRSFQGRLLHILPASDKKTSQLDEFEIAKLPLKKQKALKRQKDAPSSYFSWNSLYMNPDAVLSSIASRLGVSKSEVLDPTSSDAAVKQAHAETHVIKETKTYLQSNGINIDAFKNKARDDRTILLKNFSFGTSSDELKGLLEPFGSISKLVLPPSGTMAVAQFDNANSALQALRSLAYRNFKGSVLFLEKAPQGLLDEHTSTSALPEKISESTETDKASEPQAGQPQEAFATVFVRNLNFSTTTSRLIEAFRPLSGFLSATVKTRTEAKRPGEILSMGFGFVEFKTKSQAEAAIATMNGYKLENHELLVKLSNKVLDAAEERRRENIAKKSGIQKTKIIIKNLPFEASKKDLKSLFGAYGQLRTVRVPKKFDQSTRGFAFADFLTAKEAENAMESLANTHLLGRRLVLEFAAGEAIDPEEEIRALERKVGMQTDMVQLNKVTGSARRKFNVEARDGDE